MRYIEDRFHAKESVIRRNNYLIKHLAALGHMWNAMLETDK